MRLAEVAGEKRDPQGGEIAGRYEALSVTILRAGSIWSSENFNSV